MVVIDASALIELLLDAARFPRIEEIVRDHELHAPHLLDIEIVHSLRHAVFGNRLAAPRAFAALQDFADLTIRRHSHDRLVFRIWELRDNVTAYDAAYVALAESLNLPLITRDRRLAHSSGHTARIEYID
ncbi:MAG TPA: type II toxin-antitoxin system VapC family toxin [Thermoanaerobaculia bacterium]|jgi:predicted nucleic acid-binding protein|nr:type II toxin-antitoxin system VapC family toxin [Thermoanaerobaculia bacterium]